MLWHGQRTYKVAHDLLKYIHSWFTQGFNSPELIEAKALLDEQT